MVRLRRRRLASLIHRRLPGAACKTAGVVVWFEANAAFGPEWRFCQAVWLQAQVTYISSLPVAPPFLQAAGLVGL